MSYEQTLIDLMRHGEPVGGRLFRGSIDDPLTEQGWQQMRGSVGDYGAWQKIYSSPLQRCRAFAEQLSESRKRPLEVIDNIKEISFGEWEGLSPDQVMQRFPGLLEAYWQDPTAVAPPGGEHLQAFRERTLECWNGFLNAHRGGHVLVVTHGGSIRTILNHILQMPLTALWRIEVPYANVSRIRITHYGDGSMTQNLVSHTPAIMD